MWCSKNLLPSINCTGTFCADNRILKKTLFGKWTSYPGYGLYTGIKVSSQVKHFSNNLMLHKTHRPLWGTFFMWVFVTCCYVHSDSQEYYIISLLKWIHGVAWQSWLALIWRTACESKEYSFKISWAWQFTFTLDFKTTSCIQCFDIVFS